MEHIPLPATVAITPNDSPHTATVTIEPFFPGYGTTVGNALRRVLLSSIPGAAVTSFIIKGVQHEFSTLPYVKEDFVEISLNLKQLRLKIHGSDPVRIHLKASGERKVTGADITGPSGMEIINHDLLIATLTDTQATLEMELIAKPGRGYEPTESREKEELEVGMIALDALYSPVRRVGFVVESVRVGQMTNWDKLILEIETDGTITPEQALLTASQYLVEQFTWVLEHITTTGEPAATLSADLPAPTTPSETPAEAERTRDNGGETSSAEPSAEPKKRGRKNVNAGKE